MTTERKTIGATIEKAEEDGTFEAVIATLGVIDKDGDVIHPGAFVGAAVRILPSHDKQSVPLGKARIEERGNKAVAVGRFNLDIPAARDWSSSLKFDLENPPAVQEWSWGFLVPEGGAQPGEKDGQKVRDLLQVKEIEVSPVLLAAGVGTETLIAKDVKADGMSDNDLRERLEQALTEMEPSAEWLYVEAVFDGVVVYNFHAEGEPSKTFERPYSLDGDTVRLGSGRTEVVRDVSYRPVGKGAGVQSLAKEIEAATDNVNALILKVREVSEGRKERGRQLGKDVRIATIEMAQKCAELMDELTGTIESEFLPQDEVAKDAARFLAAQALRKGLIT